MQPDVHACRLRCAALQLAEVEAHLPIPKPNITALQTATRTEPLGVDRHGRRYWWLLSEWRWAGSGRLLGQAFGHKLLRSLSCLHFAPELASPSRRLKLCLLHNSTPPPNLPGPPLPGFRRPGLPVCGGAGGPAHRRHHHQAAAGRGVLGLGLLRCAGNADKATVQQKQGGYPSAAQLRLTQVVTWPRRPPAAHCAVEQAGPAGARPVPQPAQEVCSHLCTLCGRGAPALL